MPCRSALDTTALRARMTRCLPSFVRCIRTRRPAVLHHLGHRTAAAHAAAAVLGNSPGERPRQFAAATLGEVHDGAGAVKVLHHVRLWM